MAEEHEYDADDMEEFDDLDADLDDDIAADMSEDDDEEAGSRRQWASNGLAKNVWQRIDSRWESQWLREQLSDWDDWDEGMDAV